MLAHAEAAIVVLSGQPDIGKAYGMFARDTYVTWRFNVKCFSWHWNQIGEWDMQVAEEGSDNLRERVARIEAIIPHLATKAWVLGGVLGGMVAAGSFAAGIAAIIVRWWG